MNFTKEQLKDLVVRALYTFVQAALAAFVVSGGKLDKTTAIAALAAGISAVKTFVVEYLKARK